MAKSPLIPTNLQNIYQISIGKPIYVEVHDNIHSQYHNGEKYQIISYKDKI